MEDTLVSGNSIKKSERAKFLDPLAVGSAREAQARGASLGLLRPKNVNFHWRKKSNTLVEAERLSYQRAVAQRSFLDDELQAFEPTPYVLRFSFEDEDGRHNYTNADWESHAWFFRERENGRSEQETLELMRKTFNEDYAARGMMFAIGNVNRRPKTWQLLGVLRVDHVNQLSLI